MPRRNRGIGLLLALAAAPLAAQNVTLTGRMGERALLVIDGKTVTAAPGQTVHGVRVTGWRGETALVEVRGERRELQLGVALVAGAGEPVAPGRQILLTADASGHFQTLGTINGRTVTFMVDTGATSVSLSAAEADRIGLAYRQGTPIGLQTANGVVRGWRVSLASVRIGEVEVFQVEGVVAQRDMPFVLLGNSFLSRFQMRRDNDLMTLERRY